MIPFHSVLPELAQQEVRWVHVGHSPDTVAEEALRADEYAFLPYRLRLRRHYRLLREAVAKQP